MAALVNQQLGESKGVPQNRNCSLQAISMASIEGSLLDKHESASAEVKTEFLRDNTAAFMADPKNDVTRLLLQKHDIQKAFVDQERVGALGHVFSHKVPIEGDPTNQKSSGRCWQFAALNVLRLKLMKKYNLPKSFQFSQSYLFFFDKIERSNWFLEKILETASEDVGSRIVQVR